MTNASSLAIVCALSALFSAVAARAAESPTAPSEAAPTCIRLNKIRSTEVIDRKHILFRLRGGDMYVNKLPNACPGLRIRGSFITQSKGSPEVCDLGLITPLVKIGPGTGGNSIAGLMPFGNCALGKFEWVAKPDVEMLRAELKEAQQEEPLEPGALEAVEVEPAPQVQEPPQP